MPRPGQRPTGRTTTTTAEHCGDPDCGLARTDPGRPPAGWIQVHRAGYGLPHRWYCSWRCVAVAAIRHELGYPPLTATDRP